jgi:hypothetical protein
MMKRYFQKKVKFSAQGTLEFALVVPIFLLLLMGIIECGRIFGIISSVNTATREAVRYGAAVGTSENGVPYYQDCTGIQAAAQRIGFIAGIEDTQIDIRYDKGPLDSRTWTDLPTCPMTSDQEEAFELGDRIVVRIHNEYSPLLFDWPLIPINNQNGRTIVKNVDIYGTPAPTPSPIFTPTPTHTATNTPTNTPTPTETPTLTNTPTPLYSPTPTSTPTSTATNTSTATHTTTPTMTATPPPNCTELSIVTRPSGGDIFPMLIPNQVGYRVWNTNVSGNVVRIEGLSITWTAGDELTTIDLLDPDITLWDGSNNTGTINLSFTIDKEHMLLSGASSRDLILTFTAPPTEMPAIIITFTNGCEVSYTGSSIGE